jgi:hypothetical protein
MPEVLPVSTKQSIASFLSRPTEGVQALVGGYIGGLVPKLKYDSKSQAEEQEEPAKPEQAISRDKIAEEKKHLSLQREKASCYSAWFYIVFIFVKFMFLFLKVPKKCLAFVRAVSYFNGIYLTCLCRSLPE